MCWVSAVPYVLAAVAAAGSYQQTSTAKAQAQYQSQVASNNAKVAEWQAQDAKERGDTAAAAVRRKYAGLQGTQAASLAARGLDISEGSANALLTDTDFFGDYDQRVTRSNAQREAWGFRVRAGNFQGDAAAYGATADAMNPYVSGALAGTSAYFGAMSRRGGRDRDPPEKDTLLTSSSGTVSDRWYG